MSIKQIQRERDLGIEIGYEINHYSSFRSDFEFDPILPDKWKPWKDIDEFHEYLVNRNHENESSYGNLERDVFTCQINSDKNWESILSDIISKNERNGMGNVNIPETEIKLVNYSYCPKCNLIYTQQDLMDYYNKPVIRPGNNLRYTLRKETRVICKECNTAFYPTLIIVDGSPKNSLQYLCRMQTINSIEEYLIKEFNGYYLTKKKKILFIVKIEEVLLVEMI